MKVDKKTAEHTELKEVGFNYITLDLEGYRSGSMDEVYEHRKD